MKNRVILFVVALSMLSQLQASVYFAPASEAAPLHNDYQVAVRCGDQAFQSIPVYAAEVNFEKKGIMAFVLCSSDFSEPLEFRISRSHSKWSRVRVRPSQLKLKPVRDMDDVLLRISQPVKCSVEFDEGILDNLVLIIRGLEPDHEIGPRSGLTYYGPGVHYLGGDGRGTISARTGDTIYIADGAIVYGRIDTGGHDDISILGRGILCGSKFTHKSSVSRPPLIYLGHGKNIWIEGITLLDAPSWNMHLHNLSKVSVKDLAVFAWMSETDGIDPRACQDLVIEDCFFRTSDDSVSIKLGNHNDVSAVIQANRRIAVRHCTLWPDKAHALLIGPEGAAANPSIHMSEDLLFQNCDILRGNERNPDFYGCLAIMASDNQVIQRVLYDNIRIEGLERGNFIDVRFVDNVYTKGFGREIRDIEFRNISVDGPLPTRNRIFGLDKSRQVQEVQLNSIIIAGKPLEKQDVQINEFVQDLKIRSD